MGLGLGEQGYFRSFAGREALLEPAVKVSITVLAEEGRCICSLFGDSVL